MGCFLFMANVVPMVSFSSSSSQTPVYGSTRVIVMRRKFSRVSTVSTAIKQFYLIKSEVIFVLLICTTCLCIRPESDARISPLGRLGGVGVGGVAGWKRSPHERVDPSLNRRAARKLSCLAPEATVLSLAVS